MNVRQTHNTRATNVHITASLTRQSHDHVLNGSAPAPLEQYQDCVASDASR